MDYKLLYWPVAVVAMAWMQGRLMPAIRRTPPGQEADEQSVALHIVGTFAYGWAVYLVPTWPHLVAAFLSRVLLFDPALNLAARRPAFEVGKTALWDRLLRKLSPAKPERLSVAVRLVALAGAVVAALLLSSCRGADTTRTQPGQPVSTVSAGPVTADSSGVNTGKLPDGLNTTQIRGNTAGYVDIPPRRLFGLLPPAKRAKYKNVTFTTVVGNDNQVQQTGKKAQAPVGQAAPNASLNQADSKTGIAQAGENLKAEQKQAEVKPWYGFLLGPVGVVLGLAVAAALVYGVVQYKRARTLV